VYKFRRWIAKKVFPEIWEAVVWMTGSNDFGPQGLAYDGYKKIVVPVLK